MRKSLVLLLTALSTVSVTFAGSVSQASPASTGADPDPVVWAVGDLCDSLGACQGVGDLITSDGTTDGVALAGDLAYDNGSPADFKRFDTLFGSQRFPDGQTIRQKSYPVAGNHEQRDPSQPCPYYYTYFGATLAGTCDTPSWKARTLPASGGPGSWRVITLNTNYAAEPTSSCNAWCGAGKVSTRYSSGLTVTEQAKQREFLRTQCRGAQANGQGAIVVYHHPALADGSYTPGTRLGRDLFTVAAANGCEIVLVGHDHLYERFSPRGPSGAPTVKGTTQFLVGTGGHSPNGTNGRNTAVDQWVPPTGEGGALRMVLTPVGAKFEMRTTLGTTVDSGTVPIT